jgi:hypothetical protein
MYNNFPILIILRYSYVIAPLLHLQTVTTIADDKGYKGIFPTFFFVRVLHFSQFLYYYFLIFSLLIILLDDFSFLFQFFLQSFTSSYFSLLYSFLHFPS